MVAVQVVSAGYLSVIKKSWSVLSQPQPLVGCAVVVGMGDGAITPPPSPTQPRKALASMEPAPNLPEKLGLMPLTLMAVEYMQLMSCDLVAEGLAE